MLADSEVHSVCVRERGCSTLPESKSNYFFGLEYVHVLHYRGTTEGDSGSCRELEGGRVFSEGGNGDGRCF